MERISEAARSPDSIAASMPRMVAPVCSPAKWMRPSAVAQARASRVAWQQDPLAGGAWANWAPGQATRLAKACAAAQGRIHFAGEHTGATIRGMEAAMESGERAASEILSTL